MKLIISLACLTTLVIFVPKDQVSPIIEEQVKLIHVGSEDKKPEISVLHFPSPACTRDFLNSRAMSSETSPDGVASPVHCTSCSLGVYFRDEDNQMHCSYCKHLQD